MAAPIDPTTLPVESPLAIRLKTHVEFLASERLKGRKPGTPGHADAAAYIQRQFQEAQLLPLPSLGGYGQVVHSELGENLIGVRPPTDGDHASRWLLIGAHYDHLGERGGKIYLGADDNASSVAILTELAAVLPALHRYGVLFIAFTTEEAPYIRSHLMGSQVFVQRLPPEIGSPAQVQAVMIMDLMGGAHWEPMHDAVFAAGAEKSPELFDRLTESMAAAPQTNSRLSVFPVGMHLIEELPYVGHAIVSDYDAFRNAGVPYLFLSSGRTPRYHKPTDAPNTLHYERMAATVEWLADLLRRIDRDGEPYRFERDREEVSADVETLKRFVAPASHWETRIPDTPLLAYHKLKREHRWLQQLDLDAALKTDRANTL